MRDFGKWLWRALHRQDMTQRDLARKLHRCETVVSKWVNGTRLPNGAQLEEICNALGYHIEFVKNEVVE